MNKQFIIEMFLVGMEVVFFSLLIKKVIKLLNIKIENEIYILMITGSLTHFFREKLKINEKYCKKGYACKKVKGIS